MPKPEDTDLYQQRLPAWAPILTPRFATLSFASLGVPLLALGTMLLVQSAATTEHKKVYDDHTSSASSLPCHINKANAGTECVLTFEIEADMAGPVYLYYEIDNFYQNHRTYVNSRSDSQLLGDVMSDSSDVSECWPLKTNGSKVLSPCGLIANTLFSDTFSLTSSGGQSLSESNIAWASDIHHKYFQPSAFDWALLSDATDAAEARATCAGAAGDADAMRVCSAAICSSVNVGAGTDDDAYSHQDCRGYICAGGDFDDDKCDADDVVVFYYPKDETSVQYIYRTFPQVVSPLVGVKNEHFAVWMRTAAQPAFRKKYGRIGRGLSKGDVVSINVTNNFEVGSFKGSKAIVLASPAWFGTKNPTLGLLYVLVGGLCVLLCIALLLVKPRRMGITQHIK